MLSISHSPGTSSYHIANNNHNNPQTKERIEKINQALASEKGIKMFEMDIKNKMLRVCNTSNRSHFVMAAPSLDSPVIQGLLIRCDESQPSSALNNSSS
ncbi:hypothetical protein [Pseudomonas chlororaphis]